jgi:hypothetical protein
MDVYAIVTEKIFDHQIFDEVFKAAWNQRQSTEKNGPLLEFNLIDGEIVGRALAIDE